MTKEEIFIKATDILVKKEEDRLYLVTCIKAEICPDCGEEFSEATFHKSNNPDKLRWFEYNCNCGFKHQFGHRLDHGGYSN